jgi:BirA family biotin operon repressor/biotin-[acetyl-CoA-carboxylase] ligase
MTTKEKVIEALEKEKGSYISGEALAKSCGVSRNAIWKSITELREGGYPIQSVNNRGYMLEEASDIISKTGICMQLQAASADKPRGKDWPDRISVYEELDSTNGEAKRSLFQDGGPIPHGTAIIAKRQTAGRGHGGSRFPSPDGGIYLTVILDPAKLRGTGTPITETISAAVLKVLEEALGSRLDRKADSSIYLGKNKICGILTEGISDLETGEYSSYIVGIGIRLGKLHGEKHIHTKKNELIASLILELIS